MADPPAGEVAALRERLRRLTEAAQRINESLEFETVLQGVLDTARSLTGARYGVLTLHGEAGELADFLSSGLTEEEATQLWDLPNGVPLYAYLSSRSEPIRLRDMFGHMRVLGLPELSPPVEVGEQLPLLGAPIVHLGNAVGGLYFSGKLEGEEFSSDDEDALVMFAAQAAMVIANARRYRDERRARTDLETLINTSPVGVVVLDAQSGAVLSVNREAYRMAESMLEPGQTAEQLVEQLTVRRAEGEELSLQEFPLLSALNRAELIRAEEIEIHAPDGHSIHALINSTPISSEQGEVESVVVTLQDMTPLEESARLRADFLAMVSHELRTPLSSIRGSATALFDDGAAMDPAEMRQFHRIIVEQADQMRGLITDLLDIARIETGSLSIRPEPTGLARLVDEARSSFPSGLEGERLRLELEGDLPDVMADRRRVAQVLGNLLSNAVRHSPAAAPIRVTARRMDVHVAISVVDEGSGIAKERLPQLFRRFRRSPGGEGPGETGLGLAICKGIVEAHGGRIWATSEGLGLGATFTFTLPAAEPGGGGGIPAPDAEQAGAAAPGRLRVLAVDDDPLALRYVRDCLSRTGYEPFATGDPEEALQLAARHEFDAVLLDLMLPDTDGVELMGRILELGDLPVIFVSAYQQDELIARALEAGALDYVVKPFSAAELAARIQAALRRWRELPPELPEHPYALGELAIDYASRSVRLAGADVRLTPTEYDLLFQLAAAQGRVVTYDQLIRRVWNERDSDGGSALVRTVVRRLRRKLGDDAGAPTYIWNVPRTGYRMPPSEGAEPPQDEPPTPPDGG